MRTRLLMYFFIVLVGLSWAGQAFGAANLTVTPTKVPKGAYVNYNDVNADDNYYWQTLTYTLSATQAINATIDFFLPSGLYVADVDKDGGGDAGIIDEISVVCYDASTASFVKPTVAGSTSTKVQVKITVNAGAPGDKIYVMVPVISPNPSLPTDDWYVNVTSGDDIDDIADGFGAFITYVNPGPTSIQQVSFKDSLAITQDATTTTFGEVYPETVGAVLAAGLTDLLPDGGNGNTDEISAASAPLAAIFVLDSTESGTETPYKVWASLDSTLAHVSAIKSGVIQVINYTTQAAYTDNEGGLIDEGLATGNLPEGDWYFYVTSPLTGDFPLMRSGRLTVYHYPQVDVVGWDRDDNGSFTTADDEPVTMDSGAYLDYTGAVGASTRTETNLYISVDDFDDNARVLLFCSTNAGLTASNIKTSGTAPNITVTGLNNATALVSTLYENNENLNGYIVWNWDVTPVGAVYIPAGNYTVYAVANDGKHQTILPSLGLTPVDPETVNIRHSPNIVLNAWTEYDLGTDIDGADVCIDPSQTPVLMISWGKQGVTGDSDIDNSATIDFYIDYQLDDGTAQYGANQAGAIRLAASNSSSGIHLIASGLLEDPESKSQSYYEWDLRKETAWYPYDVAAHGGKDFYHLYAIIDEGGGGTARVVALGDDGLLDAGEDITDIDFDNDNPDVRVYTPPVKNVTLGVDESYRIQFDAFDLDQNSDVIILLVKEGASNGAFKAGNATGAGDLVTGIINAFCITSTDGSLANKSVLKENTARYYDFKLALDGAAITYTKTIANAGGLAADGTWWVYVCVDNARPAILPMRLTFTTGRPERSRSRTPLRPLLSAT